MTDSNPTDEGALKLIHIIKGIYEVGGKVDMGKAAEQLKIAVPEYSEEIDRVMRPLEDGDTEAAWERRSMSTRDEILSALGEEAHNRLIGEPTLMERCKAVEAVMQNPTRNGVNDLDAFMYDFLLQSIDISVKFGYALAMTEGRLCDFEEWLRKAIVSAGLSDYKPDLDWEKHINHEAGTN